MMRVYKDFLRRTLLLLLYHRELGYGLKQAVSWSNSTFRQGGRSNYANQEQREKLKSLLAFLEDGSFTTQAMDINGMIDELIKQLEAGEQVSNDRDLIDTIVRIVSLPHARNVMSGQTLQMLRSAILLPDELVSLRAKLKGGIACMSCGHEFLNGEMSTYNNGPSDHIGWHCTRCQKPTSMASETDISKSTPVSAIKGLAAAMKRKSTDTESEAPSDPEAFVSAADSILSDVIRIPTRRVVAAPTAAQQTETFLRSYYVDSPFGSNPPASRSFDLETNRRQE